MTLALTFPGGAVAHQHVSERETAEHQTPCGWDDARWEDCFPTSTVMFLRLTGHPEIPASHQEAEALRCDGGAQPTGGTSYAVMSAAVRKRYGFGLPRQTFGTATVLAALKPGTAAIVGGSMAAFGSASHWSRWDPSYDGLHVVAVARRDSTDRVWWMDPEAPVQYRDASGVTRDYVGEWMSDVDLASFMNAGGDKDAVIAPMRSSQEAPMLDFTIVKPLTGTVTVAGSGHAAVRLSDGARIGLPDGNVKTTVAAIRLTVPLDAAPGDRQSGYLIGDQAAILLASDVRFAASPDRYVEGYAAAKNAATQAVTAI